LPCLMSLIDVSVKCHCKCFTVEFNIIHNLWMLCLLPHDLHIGAIRIRVTGLGSLWWREICTEFHGSLWGGNLVSWSRGLLGR
jgi:hypothetical protein